MAAAAELLQDGIRVSAAGVEGFAAKLGKMGLCERTLGELIEHPQYVI